jgi:hypothetical protein
MTTRTFTLDGNTKFPATDREGYDGSDWEAVMEAAGLTEPDETRIEETTDEYHGFATGSLCVWQPGAGFFVMVSRN